MDALRPILKCDAERHRMHSHASVVITWQGTHNGC
ncbi:hypothetical protein PMI21_04036 [Pseudomonas sp. GM18]|nr:hypothetical protein PMI21_04036 [Pseudomonas sp. GM18]